MSRINNSITKIAVRFESYPAILSDAVQRMAFENDFSWKENGTEVSHLDKPVLTFNRTTKTISSLTSADAKIAVKSKKVEGKVNNPYQILLDADTDLSLILEFLRMKVKLFNWIDDGDVSISGNSAVPVKGGIQVGCWFVPTDDVFRIANKVATAEDVAAAGIMESLGLKELDIEE